MDVDRETGLIPVTADKFSVQVAINSWRLVWERANKTLSSRTEDQLLRRDRLCPEDHERASRRPGRRGSTLGDQTNNTDLTHEEVRHRPSRVS
jgi:hypothetical protein